MTDSTDSTRGDGTIRPYRIDIAQADLQDLRDRLSGVRLPPTIAGTGSQMGVTADYLAELAEHWRTGYDWRVWERRLNELPQFTTTIDGQNIHFLHVRSPEADAIPLILTHGWPGSFTEFLDVIGPLTDPRAHGADPANAFHLVVPSIPGYGFSSPLVGLGWDPTRVAGAWAQLMARLGYDRYGAQGGDWGSIVSQALGRVDAEHVIGVHLNFMPTDPVGTPGELDSLGPDEKARLDRNLQLQAEGGAYFALQASRPQTLAFALADSPAGQLAWIVERFEEWTDSTVRPQGGIDRDRILTDVMLYWLTNTAGSSAHFYYEVTHTTNYPQRSETPTGVAVFPYDIQLPIRTLANRAANVVRWTEFDRGGHFAAMEQPDLLVGDIRAFFRDVTR